MFFIDGKKRLRIGHVTLGLDTGGQEKMLAEFARHADRDRFELHCIALGVRGPLADTLEDLDCPVTTANEPGGLRPGLVWRLARLFRRLNLDVIHTHDERPLLYGVLAARLGRIRTVIHTHHHGALPHISRRQALLVRLAARLTDHFVCVSQDAARHVRSQGVPESKLLTLWNGIDLDRFGYRGFCPGGPLVTVARLSPEKGLDHLLRALASIARLEPGIRLEIAGDGPLRGELEQLTGALGLHDHVRFLGDVRDVPALLARASLFILPSLSEGISLTLLEAMARGLPVVTTRVGGNVEVVIDGETGLLVPPGDAVALSEAIRGLLQNSDRCQFMGRAGRRRVEAYFDIREVVGRYERLYLGAGVEATARVGIVT